MAQTTGIIEGVDIIVTAGGVQIDHLTDWTLTTDRGVIDVTTQQSSKTRDILTDTLSWSLSFTIFVAYDSTEGFKEITASINAGTLETIVVGTGITGDEAQTGTGHYTSTPMTGGVGAATSMAVTLEGTGALVLTTIT